MTPAEQFREVIHKELGVAPAVIIGDGKTRRFSTNGKARDDGGEYRFYDDKFPAGFAKDYRRGIYFKWSARDDAAPFSESERAERDKIIRDREERRQREQAEAARLAQERLNIGNAVDPAHQYLVRKRVRGHGVRQDGDTLLIPVMDGEEVISVQSIGPDGRKLFQLGSRVKGGFFTIGDASDVIYIVEGYATGATIHELTGQQTVVAFNAGNLLVVAPKIRAMNPETHIVICADDDFKVDGNPGLRDATKAAKAIGGFLAVPTFERDKGEAGTDFNDLCALHGSRAVQDALDAALDAGTLKSDDDHVAQKERNAYAPPGEAAPPHALIKLEIICAADFAGAPIPRMRWHVPELIPAHNVTMLGGDGAAGKSLLALQLAEATARGGDWIGTAPEPGRVIFLRAEDERDELHRRLAAINPNLAELHDLYLVPLAGKDAVLAAPDGREGLLKATPLFEALKRLVEKFKPGLLILDTLADLFGGDEIKKVHARQFIGLLRGLALDYEVTIVLLSHPSLSGMKTGEGTSGNTAWNNSVRSRLYLERQKNADGSEDDTDIRVLTMKKANRAAIGGKIVVRYCEGRFVREDAGAIASEVEREAERVFLVLLRQFAKEGRSVSPSPSKTYAPTLFAEHPDAGRVAKEHFAKAMARLLSQGRVRIEEHGPPSRRSQKLVISEALQ